MAWLPNGMKMDKKKVKHISKNNTMHHLMMEPCLSTFNVNEINHESKLYQPYAWPDA